MYVSMTIDVTLKRHRSAAHCRFARDIRSRHELLSYEQNTILLPYPFGWHGCGSPARDDQAFDKVDISFSASVLMP